MSAVDDLLSGGTSSNPAAPAAGSAVDQLLSDSPSSASSPGGSTSAVDQLLSTSPGSAPSTGGGSAVDSLLAATPGSAPAGAPPKGGRGFLGSIFHGAGKVAGAIGSVAGEAGKEVYGVGLRAGENVVNDVANTHLGPASGWRSTPGQAGLGGLGILPSQTDMTAALNKAPILGGIPRGLQQTGEEIAHPSRIAKNYSANPVSAALNDLGNLALVVGPAGEAIKGAAVGGDSLKAATAAQKAGEISQARLNVARLGAGIREAGNLQTLPLRGAKAGLIGLAGRAAANPEMLRAVDETATMTPEIAAAQAKVAETQQAASQLVPVDSSTPLRATSRAQAADISKQLGKDLAGPGRGASAAPAINEARAPAEAALKAAQEELAAARAVPTREASDLATERLAAQAKVAGQGRGIKNALAGFGTKLQDPTKAAIQTGVDMMNRIKTIAGDTTLDEADKAAAKKEVVDNASRTIQSNPHVESLNEHDLASISAAAKDAHMTPDQFTRSLGFTSVFEATGGRIPLRDSFMPTHVADAMSSFISPIKAPGPVGAALESTNRLAMVGKLALNPVAPLNRLGHGMFISADTARPWDALKSAIKAGFGKLSPADAEEVAGRTGIQHGAVWEAKTKAAELAQRAAATEPSRVAEIKKGILNTPTELLAKSPFLRMARAMDDATRSGIWLSFRHAGATPEEADLLLNRAAGTFDRATAGGRNISKAIPFYNWHKQALLVLTHMAEDQPARFAALTQAASRMADYNEQQGIYGNNTRMAGHDVNLSFLNPFSATGSVATPSVLASPVLKGVMPMALGVNPNGKAPSAPPGVDNQGRGWHQIGAAEQNLIKSLPQTAAAQSLATGGRPLYGNGQPVAGQNITKRDALNIWSTLLGVPTEKTSTAQATTLSIAASKARADKLNASKYRSYQKKAAQGG